MESILNRILYKFRREKLDSSWKNRNQIIIDTRILDLSKGKKHIRSRDKFTKPMLAMGWIFDELDRWRF